jgi:hypothetical protein
METRAATAHGWDVETRQERPGLVAPGKWHTQDVGMSRLWTTARDLGGYELIWEIFYSVFYQYDILPTSDQILNIGYSVLLFLAIFMFSPGNGLVCRMRSAGSYRAGAMTSARQVSAIARVMLLLTASAILLLTLLYRGLVGGGMARPGARHH